VRCCKVADRFTLHCRPRTAPELSVYVQRAVRVLTPFGIVAGFQRSGRMCREHCRTADQVARYREALLSEQRTAEKGKELVRTNKSRGGSSSVRRPASALTGREIRKLTKELRQSRVSRPARVSGRTLTDYDRTLGDAKYTFDPRASVRLEGSRVATAERRMGSHRTSAGSYGEGIWSTKHLAPRHSKRAANFSTAAHFTTTAFM